jgi:TonB-dependent receptor
MRKHILAQRSVALKAGVSLVTLAAFAALAAGAYAQDAAPAAAPAADEAQEVVVVGVRRALKTAQDIKKNADTHVDSITATDIGAFPDKSVAEALQRVPGITVSRFQSSDDSTHFSAEPAQVLIRGLTFVRTELNGRDIFTADGARGLNFNDVSPELMAGVDSYKNQTAEMIEGGIAGSVNLRTRLPFDSKGQVIALSAKANYGDRSEKTTFEFSGIYTNRWQTSAGEFGIMLNYAQSHLLTQTEGVVMQRIGAFCDGGYSNAGGNIVSADGSVPCTSNPYGGDGWVYIPDQVNYSQVKYDRDRHGTALAFQYQNNEKTVQFTVQYNDTYYKNAWKEHSSNIGFFGMWAAPSFMPQTTALVGPAPGTPDFVFGEDGMLQSGTITVPSGGWGGSAQAAMDIGSVVPGLPFVNYCGDPAAPCANNRQGVNVSDESRIFNHEEGTKDISANLKWQVNDHLRTSFDVQYVKAETNNYDILVAANTLADAQYSVNGDGTPQIKLLPGSNVNYAPGFLTNLHNWYIPFIQDHYEDNDATQLSLRADAEYDFSGGGWLNSLKVGVRHADRDQKVRYSAYNWSPVVQTWNACDAPGFSIDNTSPAPYTCQPGRADFKGYGAGIWSVEPLRSGFYDGNVFNNGPQVFLSDAVLTDYDRQVQALSSATTNSPLGWTPLCQRAANTEGCFIDQEMLDVTEKTNAAYAMLKFGGADTTVFGGITLNGNIGIRYVETEVESHGGVAFNSAQTNWYNNLLPCGTGTLNDTTYLLDVSCYVTDGLKAFTAGAPVKSTFGGKHSNWLPSLNLRFGLTDSQFIRFGASRALSRPDYGQLRNYVTIQAPTINTSANSPYIIWNNPSGPHVASNVKGYNFVFTADSGNAALEPITADQFDLSYENYLNATSSFTFDLFYKKLNGDISYSQLARGVTFNGETQNVIIRGPGNGKGGGELKGFEVAYQTFFDFLPSPWDGFGIQANYTHVDQSGINNSNLANQPGYAGGGTLAFGGGLQVSGVNANGAPAGVFDSHRLAGISDDSYNIVLLYEKGRFASRLAYNWRSDFLTNNLDCCIGLPMYQKGNGFLDLSLRYKLNDNIELSFDGSNLLDTTTVMQQQLFGDSDATPGAKAVRKDSAWIRNDRRYQIGVRFKY